MVQCCQNKSHDHESMNYTAAWISNYNGFKRGSHCFSIREKEAGLWSERKGWVDQNKPNLKLNLAQA